MTVTIEEWTGCYDDSWKDVISDESFQHPAKMAPGLLRRILKEGIERGWFAKGDIIGDPFAGVGTTAIMADAYGLRVVGTELEPKFCAFAQENLSRHKIGPEQATIVQGDAREFARLVGECSCVVSSPPFCDSGATLNVEGHCRQVTADRATRKSEKVYGSTPGQLGAMKPGTVSGVVTSPPYEGIAQSGGTDGLKKHGTGLTRGERSFGDYGQSEGQLGNTTGDTYWQAIRDVLLQLRIAVKPGGVICWIVKDYIKAGKRVPLCDDTCTLFEHLGFAPETRVHAMLVKEERHPSLFGGEIVNRKERKSFFRRLAESKGSPPIDWEEVLVYRSPSGGDGRLDGCCTSPPYADSIDNHTPDSLDCPRLDKAASAKLSKADLSGRNYGTSPGQIASLKPGRVEDAL